MEDWEKNYITQQLVPLINNILCDTVLLASLQTHGVLSDVDVEKVDTSIGRFEKSKVLLDILKTKVHAYEALIKALISCNQSGAYNILLDGFQHERILNLKLTLGKVQISLRDILNETTIGPILSAFKKTLPPLSYLKFCLQTNLSLSTLYLVKDTILSELHTFKNRTLLSRCVGNTLQTDSLGERDNKTTFLTALVSSNIEGCFIHGGQGSGKTTLLTKLGYILSEIYPERVVSFIYIPAFLQLVGKPLPFIKEDPFETLKLVSKYISPTLISQVFLLEILQQSKYKLELLFDGIDEVSTDDIEWVSKFITKFKQLSFTRVFVTVGPETVKCIESTTSLKGYDIVEFTDEEHDELLYEIWVYQNPDWDAERLRTVSTSIGNFIRKSLTDSENKICGRPLQCALTAEMYSNVAKIYCELNSSISIEQTLQLPTNLFNLYRMFMEKAFSSTTDNDLLVQTDLCTKTTLSRRFHLWTALTLRYPKLAADYNNFFEKLGHPVNFKICPTDILLLSPCSTEDSERHLFTHQTYSDYLVAECIAQLFTTNIASSSIAHTFYLNFIKTVFQQIVIAKVSKMNHQNVLFGGISQPVFELFVLENGSLNYFIDNHLKCRPTLFITKEITEIFYSMVTSEKLYGILSACTYQNFKGILILLFEILQKTDAIRRIGYKTYLSESSRFYHLLLTAVEYSDLTVVETFSQLCTNVFDYDVLASCKSLPANSLTIVHLALKNGKHQLTDYLVSKMYNDAVPLLQILICNSCRDPDDVVNKKREMVNLIISKNKNLLGHVLAMLSIGVHVEIIKGILSIDPQFVGIVNYYGNTVAHLLAKNISGEDYHKLVLFILDKPNGSKIFSVKNSHGCSALHEACYSVKGLIPETVEMIIRKSKFDVRDKDEDGNNILFSAASGNGSRNLLELLVNLGTPYKTRNDKGRNALHVAVVGTNIEAVRFFLSFGDEMNTADNNKCYPYNLAVTCLKEFQLYPNVYTAKIRDTHEIIAMLIDAGFRVGS